MRRIDRKEMVIGEKIKFIKIQEYSEGFFYLVMIDFNFLFLYNHFKILNIATTLHLKTMHVGACEFEKVI